MYIIKENSKIEKAIENLNKLPEGKTTFFKGDSKEILSLFKLSKRTHNSVLVDFENNQQNIFEKTIPIKNIKITQPYIVKSKVEAMLLNLNKLPKINVLQYKDEMVIFDGHHRLTAMYLSGIKNIKANLIIL